jgi:anthranilate synthase/aminodeoxychorismate synthase-like glutamine amidotransferase
MILLIDNYDSFVYNLARHFERLGQETVVVRNDAITPAGIRRLKPQAVVLSPGPCTPSEAGCSVATVSELAGEIPLLGVCLGHQAIAAALGAKVIRAVEPRHGRTSLVEHEGTPLLAGVPSPFRVCRYHSLTVDECALPAEMRVTARADDGCVMALEHAHLTLCGVQFHPEAVLTEHGYTLLANFLRLAGCRVTADPVKLAADELPRPAVPEFVAPSQPVTF